MTAMGMFSQAFGTPNRTWLADDHGTEVMPGVALDLTLFDPTQHYPNGWLPDGIVLGKVTSGGKYGPYLGTASDGRQTAAGIMFNPVSVFAPGTASLLTIVSVPLFLHGFVADVNLPFNSTNQALGGYIDAAAKTAMKNIIFLPAVA